MKLYFIGIGGIGVSALAQYYLANGHQVFGSDLVSSEITDFLKNLPLQAGKGVKINIGQKAENIKQDVDLVVYSPAVKSDNPEYKKAKELGIKMQSYPEALGEITKQYFTIAVSGAHGKSTTTAMAALVLVKAGLDPTVIVGTKVKEFSAQGGPASGGGNNFRQGRSRYLVIEACEYDSSFLHYSPDIIVITNIDKEHLDYFKTFGNVKKAFKDFIVRLPKNGFLVFNGDDKNLSVIARKLNGVKLTKQSSRLRLLRFARNDGETRKLRKILKVPGQHNVSNALAALQVARILKIPDKITFKALSGFKGTWRRFETKQSIIKGKKITVVSDYGHHPNEISATLKAAREKYPNKKIWCVFQPHQYQRTYYLFNDFVKIFRKAPIDKIIITDIYDVAGRETRKINIKVSSEKLVERISRENIVYCAADILEGSVKTNIKDIDVLIIMGAGDIYKLANKF